MKKTELILGLICLVTFAGTLFLIPGASILMVLSALILSSLYFYFGFALFNAIPLKSITKKENYTKISSGRIVGAIGTGLALSVTTLGLVFYIQSWPGAYFNLYIGLIGLFLVSVGAGIWNAKSKSGFYLPILKRALIFGVLALFALLLPASALLDFKYRNYPDYLAALKKSMSEPGNQELLIKADEERQKMYEEQAK